MWMSETYYIKNRIILLLSTTFGKASIASRAAIALRSRIFSVITTILTLPGSLTFFCTMDSIEISFCARIPVMEAKTPQPSFAAKRK